MQLPELPISPLLPQIQASLQQSNRLVLEAPTGAGKSTLVALSLLDSPDFSGKILLLEPRRLAARSVAQRMAQLLDEPLGKRVGYRVKQDSRVGPDTRIEVITEGILLRLLQQDPTLDGISLILFDEFHERSLNADLALSLCDEVQQQLRPDLRLVLMSATLDTEHLIQFLDCPLLSSPGRSFPVEIEYRPPTNPQWLPHLCQQLQQAIWQQSGDILVFLPGSGEIRQVMASLEADLPAQTQMLALYGDLDWAQQQQALIRTPGIRRVIVASAIAETSLTLEGIELVIDSGWQRQAVFNPNTGISHLTTQRLSQASAAQRAGRAGRTGPGRCWRLWSATESLSAFNQPEILQADLSSLALQLSAWGSSHLRWLDAPPSGALAQAFELLQQLAATDSQGHLTALGQKLSQLPLPPRLGTVLLQGQSLQQPRLAAALAAYLSEGAVRSGETDLSLQLQQQLASRSHSLFHRQYQSLLALIGDCDQAIDWSQTGLLLAAGYPDRIARRRASGKGYLLAQGTGANFAQYERLSNADWLVIANLSGREREARIFSAAELAIEQLPAWQQARWQAQLSWLDAEQRLEAIEVRHLGAIRLEQRPLSQTPADWPSILQQLLQREGLKLLPWTESARALQQRLMLAHRLQPGHWPDVCDQALTADLGWLQPYLPTQLQRQPFRDLDLTSILLNLMDYGQQQQLHQWLPEFYISPAGGRHRLDYQQWPVRVALKLQEVFGLDHHPQLAGQLLVLELLSPAGRPIQITQDLPGFWRSSYQAVRKDMHSQYPRHYWPEQPLTAQASLKTSKKALARGDS